MKRGPRHDETEKDRRIHEAGHAVVALELGLQFTDIPSGRCSIRHSFFVPALTTPDARDHVELQVIALHAGFAAQRRFRYASTLFNEPRDDLDSVRLLLGAFEPDPATILAWSKYLAARAVLHVEKPATWKRIRAVARAVGQRQPPA